MLLQAVASLDDRSRHAGSAIQPIDGFDTCSRCSMRVELGCKPGIHNRLGKLGPDDTGPMMMI